jgi:hypothetical protein
VGFLPAADGHAPFTNPPAACPVQSKARLGSAGLTQIVRTFLWAVSAGSVGAQTIHWCKIGPTRSTFDCACLSHIGRSRHESPARWADEPRLTDFCTRHCGHNRAAADFTVAACQREWRCCFNLYRHTIQSGAIFAVGIWITNPNIIHPLDTLVPKRCKVRFRFFSYLCP